jgi:hypothetical protein
VKDGQPIRVDEGDGGLVITPTDAPIEESSE